MPAILLAQVLECKLDPDLHLPPGGGFRPLALSRQQATKGFETWAAASILLTRRIADGALGVTIDRKPITLKPLGIAGVEGVGQIGYGERGFGAAPKAVRIFRNRIVPGARTVTIDESSGPYVQARCEGHLAMVDALAKGPQAFDTNGDGKIDVNSPAEYARLADGVFELNGKGYRIQGIDWTKRALLLAVAPLGPKLDEGETLVDFAYIDRLKERRFLSSHEGSFTLLDYWASWCGPCIAAFPQLKLISETHKLKVLGFNGDEDAATASRTLAQFEVLWPDVQSTEPAALMDYRHRVALYPTYILLDPTRKVVFRSESTIELLEAIRRLVPKR